LCLSWCKSEGMIVDTCFACKHHGLVREACEQCHEGQHLPPVYSIFECCEGFGPVGIVCDMCGGGTFSVVPGL
jgi:hypothetical protein